MMVKTNLVIEPLKPKDLDNIFQQYLEQPLSFFFYKNFLPTLFSKEQLVFSLSAPNSVFEIIRDQLQVKAVVQIDQFGHNAVVSLLLKDNQAELDLIQAFGDILLDFFKENLQILKLTVMLLPEETAAMEILQKLKFKQEGRLKQHLYLEGEYRDVVCWAIFREEFL